MFKLPSVRNSFVFTYWNKLPSLPSCGLKQIVQKMFHKAPPAIELPLEARDIVVINKGNFQKEVLESKLPVILDAYGTWCPPCKHMEPIFLELSKKLSGKVKFAKFNIDTDTGLTKELNVTGVPAFIFFEKGVKVDVKLGACFERDLLNKINSVFHLKQA